MPDSDVPVRDSQTNALFQQERFRLRAGREDI